MKSSFFRSLLTGLGALALVGILSLGMQSVTAQGQGSSSSMSANLAQYTSSVQTKNARIDLLQSPSLVGIAEESQEDFLELFPNTLMFLEGDTVFRDMSIGENLHISSEVTSGGGYVDSDNTGSTTGESLGVGNLNIGYQNFSQVPNDPSGARLQVDGTIKVSDLSDPSDPNTYCVCSDSFGVMKRCGIYDPANGLTCEGDSCLEPDVKLSYSGTPFDWDENIIYNQNLDPIIECSTDDPSDYTASSCTILEEPQVLNSISSSPVAGQNLSNSWYTVVMESPIPQWHRVTSDYDLTCGEVGLPNCGTSPLEGLPQITEINIDYGPMTALIPGSCD